MEAAAHAWPALGVLLVRDGLVSEEDIETIVGERRGDRQQRISSRKLGEILVDQGEVTATQVAKLVAEQYELPFVELRTSDIDLGVARRLSRELADRFQALPIGFGSDGTILTAVADPGTVLFSEELRRALGAPLRFAVVGPDALEEALRFVGEHPPATSTDIPTDFDGDSAIVDRLRSEADSADDSSAAAQPRPAHLRPPLGELLVREGHVTEAELERALAQQRLSTSRRLGEILVDRGMVTSETVARLVADQYELPFLELSTTTVDRSVALLLPEETAHRLAALPIGRRADGSIEIVVADPTRVLHTGELYAALESELVIAVAAPDAIEAAIALAHEHIEADSPDRQATPDLETDLEADPDDDPRPTTRPGLELVVVEDTVEVVGFGELEDTIARALELGASSLHFSPRSTDVLVRARIDGALREMARIPGTIDRAVLESFDAAVGGRLEAVPTRHGERLTLFLHGAAESPTLADLGLGTRVEEALRDVLRRPRGAFLACGPSGSGTTTTLYATVEALVAPERALVSIEDPVERPIDGVDQVEVNDSEGRTLAHGLRSILRADPDVVLIGRCEQETAGEIFRAAADVVVLSSLHAPNAAAAIARLAGFDLEAEIVGANLNALLAQRLVRRICPDCRETYYASESELAELGEHGDARMPRLLARGRGCSACEGTGFRGRAGIFEILVFTEEIRALVAQRAAIEEIEQAAVSAGMQALHEDGIRLCLEGTTTMAEVRRVLGSDGP